MVTAVGSVRPLPDSHDVNEVVIALVGGTPGAEPKAWGSAVFIAPGVALTASHVIEAYWKQFDDLGRWDDKTTTAGFALQAFQYVRGSSQLIVWHVIAAWHSPVVDVAVIQLVPDHDLPRDYRWPYVTLDVAPPTVGTEVQAFGFPVHQASFNASAGWALEHEPLGSRGVVTQCYPERRDRVLRNYPCFEMDIETLDGMSGGPVFDRTGYLRGINCSGFDGAEAARHVSYASILWPALALPIRPTPHLGLSEGDTRLLHLARDGRLHAINHERLRFEALEDETNAAFE